MRYWTRTDIPIEEVRRRAMLFFGSEATEEMSLVAREPQRLLFSDPSGDLAVYVQAGQPNTVSVTTSHWHAEAQDFLRRLAGPVGGVIHFEAPSERTAQEILQQARAYFGTGPEGLGLELAAEHPTALEFTGGGGNVTVDVRSDGQPGVHVSAREWDYHAEQFVRRVSSEH